MVVRGLLLAQSAILSPDERERRPRAPDGGTDSVAGSGGGYPFRRRACVGRGPLPHRPSGRGDHRGELADGLGVAVPRTCHTAYVLLHKRAAQVLESAP